MIQLRSFFAITVLAILLSSCSNDFDLTAPWKDIPVVYAIISPADTAHYIRIEKAFLDPERSALEIAKIADSLYYPENTISVFLQKKGTTTLYPLTRVDGVKEGIVRDSGIFAQSPNWLYKIKPAQLGGGLQAGATYVLIIKRADGKADITANSTQN
jgi:hypothetical protein